LAKWKSEYNWQESSSHRISFPHTFFHGPGLFSGMTMFVVKKWAEGEQGQRVDALLERNTALDYVFDTE
jgi:hypothetical protein